MKTQVVTTRSELIRIFSEWNKEYVKNGKMPILEDFKDPDLAVKVADDLISKITERENMSLEECKEHMINFIESRESIESFSIGVNMVDVSEYYDDGCKHWKSGNIFTMQIIGPEDES